MVVGHAQEVAPLVGPAQRQRMPGTPRANLRYAAYRSTLRMPPFAPASAAVGTAAEREGSSTNNTARLASNTHRYQR